MNTTYTMHESNKGEINPEKVWKSSGYIVSTWVSQIEGSLNVKDWKIVNYFVYIIETSENSYFSE